GWGSFMQWRDRTTFPSRGLWLTPIGKSELAAFDAAGTSPAHRSPPLRQEPRRCLVAPLHGRRASLMVTLRARMPRRSAARPARMTALTMRAWVPQRHRLLASASFHLRHHVDQFRAAEPSGSALSSGAVVWHRAAISHGLHRRQRMCRAASGCVILRLWLDTDFR